MSSIESKHSTGSDTATKKKSDASNYSLEEQISDRLSGLTTRILAVNIIAIMILGLGILYLGQYTESLIKGELESLQTETQFYAGALAEGAVRPVFQISPIPFSDPLETEALKHEMARRMVRRLGEMGTSRIRLYAMDGSIIADSHELSGPGGVVVVEQLGDAPYDRSFESLFKQSAMRFLDIIPMQTKLPPYPEDQLADVYSFPDTQNALLGNLSSTGWFKKDGRIILTAAAPIQKIKQVMGVVLLIRDGSELEAAIDEVRIDVFRVFLGSLGITVILSIYLSGLIGQPLQKLAAAAEAIRLGKSRQVEIPDLSNRKDEIGELSSALRDMTQALWDRMDSIERFAADVAHEIKNPLTSLRSAVETAARVEDDKSRKKLMDIIQHDVQRLDRLISDISNASRLDAELSRVELEPVDLSALLHQLTDAYSKPLKRAQGENDSNIFLSLPEGSAISVMGNKDRLSQVIGNLISNAMSFSPEDGMVTVRVTPKEKTVLIEVEDEGKGVPENNLDRIFERFYTERPNHEDYGSHSGLGLSISKQIINAHNGRIWAENIKDPDNKENIAGARFSIILNAA